MNTQISNLGINSLIIKKLPIDTGNMFKGPSMSFLIYKCMISYILEPFYLSCRLLNIKAKKKPISIIRPRQQVRI